MSNLVNKRKIPVEVSAPDQQQRDESEELWDPLTIPDDNKSSAKVPTNLFKFIGDWNNRTKRKSIKNTLLTISNTKPKLPENTSTVAEEDPFSQVELKSSQVVSTRVKSGLFLFPVTPNNGDISPPPVTLIRQQNLGSSSYRPSCFSHLADLQAAQIPRTKPKKQGTIEFIPLRSSGNTMSSINTPIKSNRFTPVRQILDSEKDIPKYISNVIHIKQKPESTYHITSHVSTNPNTGRHSATINWNLSFKTTGENKNMEEGLLKTQELGNINSQSIIARQPSTRHLGSFKKSTGKPSTSHFNESIRTMCRIDTSKDPEALWLKSEECADYIKEQEITQSKNDKVGQRKSKKNTWMFPAV